MEVLDYMLGKKAGGGTPISLQTKDVTITENGKTTINPDTGYDGMSKVDVTVSGILDTSDANATASDMALGKSGYVNGVKVNGNVPVGSPAVATNYASTDVSTYLDELKVDTAQGSTNQFFATGDKISVFAPLNNVAPVIGASAEKIKKDEVICGVTGTYEGSSGTVSPSFVSFMNYSGTTLDISWLRTNNMTNMINMFYACANLTQLDISNFDTSNVTYMSNFLDSGSGSLNFKLTNLIGLNNLNTDKVINISRFLYNRAGFNTKIDMSQSKFTVCTDFSYMFYGNRNTPEIDLKSMNSTATSYNCSNMFQNCVSLEKIDMRSFDFTKISNRSNMFINVPTNCLIIVADNTQKDWFTTNFSTYTNVKTVAELG